MKRVILLLFTFCSILFAQSQNFISDTIPGENIKVCFEKNEVLDLLIDDTSPIPHTYISFLKFESAIDNNGIFTLSGTTFVPIGFTKVKSICSKNMCLELPPIYMSDDNWVKYINLD
jgi:hypothetical protein